jgi:hypothetical protein
MKALIARGAVLTVACYLLSVSSSHAHEFIIKPASSPGRGRAALNVSQKPEKSMTCLRSRQRSYFPFSEI